MPITNPETPFHDQPDLEPSAGELALEDRSALRRVAGLSTELADISEVEYRQLRLERVVLVGVWTEGSAADNQASLPPTPRGRGNKKEWLRRDSNPQHLSV